MSLEHENKMMADVNSILDALVSDPGISPTDAANQMTTIATDFLKCCARSLVENATDSAQEQRMYGPCTPGIPMFFEYMWPTLLLRVYEAPVEEQAHEERITRLIKFVGEIKGKSHPEGEEWLIWDRKTSWQDLPFLGISIREDYNGPIDLARFRGPYDARSSREALLAMAGVPPLEPESLGGQIAKARRDWLSLQSFVSRLWRDCDCKYYALYAIWAVRPALEDWPEPSPSFEVEFHFEVERASYEEGPTYFALLVEAAAIWICNTASLMYACTDKWGPKGVPDWPENSGTPGLGGRRWDGVDGYDEEHGRWRLWKNVLAEVVQWCDREEENMRGWKVRDAAIRALNAMEEAEKSAS